MVTVENVNVIYLDIPSTPVGFKDGKIFRSERTTASIH